MQETAEANQNPPSRGSKSRKFKAPEYLREMNIVEKLENHKIIMNMNKRINYLKNPRYQIVRPPITYKDAFTKPVINFSISERESRTNQRTRLPRRSQRARPKADWQISARARNRTQSFAPLAYPVALRSALSRPPVRMDYFKLQNQ